VQCVASGDGYAKKGLDALQAALVCWAYQLGSWKEQAFIPSMDDLKADEAPATPPASAAVPAPAP
jgi:hypothetical protein